MLQRIKDYLFPRVDKEAQDSVDRDSLNSIYRVSLTVIVFETFTFLSFLLTRTSFDRDTWISLGSVGCCIVICLGGFLSAGRMLKNANPPHGTVLAFKIFFFLIFSTWAIWVSWRHYLRDDELLTFFAVELMMVCFMPLRPWLSLLLNAAVYGCLYAVLYSVDGAARVNIFNYLMVMVVSMVGMVVRYHSQLRLAEKTTQLQRKNEMLEHMSRHDGLTGLRNRMALDADVEGLLGRPVGAYMIDVDFFKELNDTFGHSVGDAVLKETGQQLRQLFPDSLCYRYGGDEFLIITTQGTGKAEEIHRFSVPEVPGREIVLCIGSAEGTPADSGEMFALINKADAGLYEVKKKTHTPELGGRDRRRR